MAYGGDSTGTAAPAARPVSTLSTATEQRAITEASLRQVVRDALGEQAAEVELRAVQGFPGHALVEVAQEVTAQLVVLAARRGEGAMSRLLGTVSQYVLRHAPCPVLVVPAGS
jgi:nucleotide-binding universal stress UspA family protein